MLLSFVMLHMSFVTFILGGSVYQYATVLQAWQHRPTYYIRIKRPLPKPPNWSFPHSTMEKKPTVLMIKQKTVDKIDNLFYGKSSVPTSLTCQQEPDLLRKLIQYMPTTLLPDNESSFSVVIDSGATASVSYVKEDFVGTIHPSPFHQMQGLAESLEVMGQGTVQWIVDLDDGKPITIETQAYYVPSMSLRLLSPQDYFHQLQNGYAIINPNNIQLHWSTDQVLTVPFDS